MCGGGSYSSWVSYFHYCWTCTAPVNLFANNITTTSATIGWDLVPGAVSYEYGIRIIGVTGWVYYTTTSNSFVFSGLSAGRQVRLRVRAICASDGSNTPYLQHIFSTLHLQSFLLILQILMWSKPLHKAMLILTLFQKKFKIF